NMDKSEEGRERAFKYVVLFAGLISLISVVSLCVTIPMAFSYVGRLDRRIQSDRAYCEETVSEIADEIVQFSYAASLIGNGTAEHVERGKRYADSYLPYLSTESSFTSGMNVQGSCCVPGPRGPPGLPGANGRPGIPGIHGKHGQPGRPPAAQCYVQAALSCPVCPAGPRGEPGRK
uniref:Nematode cuticle collagen N-terminal domain-containing protein n=1 Tax=Parascaris univalens TaxID=6257 RepID=A0A915AZX2_PARUN